MRSLCGSLCDDYIGLCVVITALFVALFTWRGVKGKKNRVRGFSPLKIGLSYSRSCDQLHKRACFLTDTQRWAVVESPPHHARNIRGLVCYL